MIMGQGPNIPKTAAGSNTDDYGVFTNLFRARDISKSLLQEISVFRDQHKHVVTEGTHSLKSIGRQSNVSGIPLASVEKITDSKRPVSVAPRSNSRK